MTEPQTTRTACPLAARHCAACEGGTEPLAGEQLTRLHTHVPAWDVIDEHYLTRTLKFPDFAQALAFVNRVGELAEREGHHPGIHLTWGKVRIELHTHAIGGPSENDFILAAKIDAL